MQDPLLDVVEEGAATPLDAKHNPAWFRAEWVANFGVQYNFTNVSIALLFLKKGAVHCCTLCGVATDNPFSGCLDSSSGGVWYEDSLWGGNVSSILKSVIFLGSIFGMCTMGYVGDIIGRNRGNALSMPPPSLSLSLSYFATSIQMSSAESLALQPLWRRH
jgi:hypothetical protein